MSNAIEQAYELGWRRSAEWSKRDDLLSDIGSPAYKRDRDEDLAHLSAQAKVRVTDEDVVISLKVVKETLRFMRLLADSAKQSKSNPNACFVDWRDVCAIKGDVAYAQTKLEELESFAARLSQGAQGEDDELGSECSSDPKVRAAYADGYDVGFAHGKAQGAQGEASSVWAVCDETGQPGFCASWPEVCHEHINDAINEHGIEEAKSWTVRRYTHPAERAAVPDGLELAAKWHEQRSELFRQEAAAHEERYNNTKDDFPKAAETHLRRWGHAQNSQVDHIECAAAIRKLAAPTLAGKEGAK